MKLLYAITIGISILASIGNTINAAVTELPEQSALYLKACYNMLKACDTQDANLMVSVIDDFDNADPCDIDPSDIQSVSGTAGKPDYYFDVNTAEDLLNNKLDLATLDSEHFVRGVPSPLMVYNFSLEAKASYTFTITASGPTTVASTSGSAKAIPVLTVADVSNGNVEAPVTEVTDYPAVFSVVNLPTDTEGTIKVSITNPDTEKRTFAVLFQ